MDAKKVTRIFFYGLAIASGLTLLSMIIIFFTSRWEDMWPIVVIVVMAGAVLGLFKLADWAFTPDRKGPSDFPVPTKKDTTNA